MARPIPRDDPVTTATFPARRAPSVVEGPPAALISEPLLIRTLRRAPWAPLPRRASVSVRLDREGGVKRRDPEEVRGEAAGRSVITRVGARECRTYTDDRDWATSTIESLVPKRGKVRLLKRRTCAWCSCARRAGARTAL